MTVIAYRDGTMAADSLCVSGGSRLGSIEKIRRNAAGDLAGAAGDAGFAGQFFKWFEQGECGDPPEAREAERSIDRGMIVRADGSADVFEPGGRFTMTAPYYAIGSGRAEALAAMYMGADAVGAVECAIALDIGCGAPIKVLSHVQKLELVA